jgi:peptide/nickel transport system permease protein
MSPGGLKALAAAMAGRLLAACATLLGAIALLFALTLLVPGNPALVLLGPRATPGAVAAYTRAMGLDRPVAERFAVFVWRALHFDLGTDPVSGRPVGALVWDVLPDTLALTASALLLALLAGVPLALLGARRRFGPADRLTMLVGLAAMAMPSFVVAILLLLVATRLFGAVPVLGGGDLRHLILPSVALALGWFGAIARLLRTALLDALDAPFVRTARAHGISETRILTVHALRVALVPVVAVLGVGVGQLLSGAVFVEAIFGRPGLGSLIVQAIGDRNYPVVQAGVLVAVGLFILANLLVDLILPWLDPRIRR